MAADAPAGGGGKKTGGLSSRLLQMKFMQKAAEKEKLQEAQKRAQQHEQQEQPADGMEEAGALEQQPPNDGIGEPSGNDASTAPSSHAAQQAGSKGCRIIYDRAPLPTGLLGGGRLSFGPKPPAEELPEAGPQQQPMAVDEKPDAAAAGDAAAPGQGPGAAPSMQIANTAASRAAGGTRGPRAGAGAMDVSDLEMASALQPQKHKSRQQHKGKRPLEPKNPYTSLREIKRAKKK